MSRLIASRKSNPCPICENSSGKCRQSATDLNYWQCMSFTDVKLWEMVGNYKCLGLTKDGMWNQFHLEDEDAEDERRDEWLRRKEERKEQIAKVQQEKAKQSLTDRDRHQQYMALLSELTLHPKDRADLVRRGFTNQEIELSGFKSVSKWHLLKGKYSNALPGVDPESKYLNVGGEGYLCPVKNEQGLIVALQIRLREAKGGEGRYRWLSSITKKNPNGQSPHVHIKGFNPELPLAVHIPQGNPERISLAEGTGVKPFLAAQRLNQLVIGAAGGLHASSPNSLKAALSLCPEIKEVSLLADAGSVANKNVINQYQRTHDLLKSWGITLTVAWWNQVSKDDHDIDELPPERYSEIRYISFDEFKAIAKRHGGIKPQPGEEKKDDWKSYIKPIEELPKIGFHVKRKNQKQLLQAFHSLDTPRGREWLKLREFNPDVTIHSKYFDYNSQPGENLAVKSGLGTGKSYFVNAKWLSNPDDGAVIGGYRNTLLEQFCSNGKKLNGRDWYQIQADLKGSQDMLLISDCQSRIAGAVDSWIYFSPYNFEGKKIIFDEIESVAKHLNQSKTAVSYNREIIRQRVTDAISLGESTFIADGNLRDFTVDYLEKLSGKKFTKVKNTYTGNRGKVYLYDGSCRKKQATEGDLEMGWAEKVGDWISADYKRDDYSKLHRIMMELPSDIPVLICSDSQTKCEAFDQELTKLGRKVFRLDSTTSGTDEGKAFLADPKAFILLHNIDTVILSPSAESGVSIELLGDMDSKLPGYFKYEFAYFFGVSTTDTQVQFIGRNRDQYTKKFIYVQDRSLAKSQGTTNDQVSSDICSMWLETVKLCASLSLEKIENDKILEIAFKSIEKTLLDPHVQYEGKLMLKESFEREYPRLCLEYALRDSGWEVLLIEGREDDLSDLREVEDEIKTKRAIAIFEAQDITPSEAEKLSRKLNKTPDERNQVTKSRLVSRLPGITEKVIVEEKKITPQEAIALQKSETEKILSIDGEDFETWAEKQPIETETDKKVKVITEKPAFNSGFVYKVTQKDRAYLSRIEAQFLLRNPELCKKIQKNKWYKRLDILTDPQEPDYKKKLQISNYKSQWVQIHTLHEMGIGFFLDPENSWHDESPEAIAFHEKGKIPAIARKIGISPGGDTPCAYIGRLLASFGIKTYNKTKRVGQSRHKQYRVAAASPLDLAIYECVSDRFERELAKIGFDWKKIVQNSASLAAESLTEQEIQVSHLPHDFYIENKGEGVEVEETSKTHQNSASLAAENLTEQEIQVSHLTPDFYIENKGEGVTFDEVSKTPHSNPAPRLGQVWEAFYAYGNKWLRTPRIQAIQGDEVIFDDAIAETKQRMKDPNLYRLVMA